MSRPPAAIKPADDFNPTAEAVPSTANGTPAPPRLAYRMADVPKALGISRRTLERERSAGRFPRPDLTIGEMPLWKVETLRDWLSKGGRA